MDPERGDPRLVGDGLQAARRCRSATISAIAIPSAPSEPSSGEPRRDQSRRQIAPTSAAASGSQIRIESIGVTSSDQEVEADAGDAEQHQRGVEAQEAALERAHGGRAGAHEAGRAADERAVDDDALERSAAKRPNAGDGPHDERVDQLVEVPLVLEERVQRARSAADRAPRSRAADPDDVGDRDAGQADARAPRIRPNQVEAVDGWTVSDERRVGERRREEVVDHVVDVRDRTTPTIVAADGQRAHRDLHRQRALGDEVVGPGEADVGVLDLAVGRVDRDARRGRGGRARARAPPGTGSPRKARKIIRNV